MILGVNTKKEVEKGFFNLSSAEQKKILKKPVYQQMRNNLIW